MSVPTVNVTCTINDSEGNPVEGARVSAKLSTAEKYNGFVVPLTTNAVSDGTGIAVLALFPNELGSEGSEYQFKIMNPSTGKSIKFPAVIPNLDCNLFEIANVPPYPREYVGDTFSKPVFEARDQVLSSVEVATQSAANSLASEHNASQFAAVAQQSKGEALTSATYASTSAGQAQTAKVAAESARDASVFAKGGAEAARDEAQAKVVSIPGLIDTEKGLAVDAVNSAKDAAVAAVQGMPEFANDEEAILRKFVNDLISGVTKGIEGRWKCVERISIVPSYIGYNTVGGVTENTYLIGETAFGSLNIGDQKTFDLRHKGFVGGNSGEFYEVLGKRASPSPILRLHPKHGDVLADFTAGNTYPVIVFQESTDSADQMEGDLDHVEIFKGSNVALADIFNVGDYAVYNPGYWNGKSWKSQLLGDVDVTSGYIVLKGGRKSTALGSSTLGVVSVRRSDGLWQKYNNTGATAPLGAGFIASENAFYVNVSESYDILGYTSEADMLVNCVIEVRYNTKARRVRPIANPSGVKVLGDVWLSNVYVESQGATLAYELGCFVPTGTQFFNRRGLFKKQNPVTEMLLYYIYGTSDGLLTTSSPNGAVALLGLYESGGTYHIALWSKELIYDTDWGDDGKINVVDNVVTSTDLNGNVVLAGCYGYDTGQAVAA
ncbi:hypothetical protein [Maridesulfovibrio bastinii]|uniref:hypothetical protein n=1 Tax=Maridesulfovibrio bastinii TaxID=47157 RepID=UPI0004011E65|nr:hypothetical protein [Maridesulfovibrio bastinii]